MASPVVSLTRMPDRRNINCRHHNAVPMVEIRGGVFTMPRRRILNLLVGGEICIARSGENLRTIIQHLRIGVDAPERQASFSLMLSLELKSVVVRVGRIVVPDNAPA